MKRPYYLLLSALAFAGCSKSEPPVVSTAPSSGSVPPGASSPSFTPAAVAPPPMAPAAGGSTTTLPAPGAPPPAPVSSAPVAPPAAAPGSITTQRNTTTTTTTTTVGGAPGAPQAVAPVNNVASIEARTLALMNQSMTPQWAASSGKPANIQATKVTLTPQGPNRYVGTADLNDGSRQSVTATVSGDQVSFTAAPLK